MAIPPYMSDAAASHYQKTAQTGNEVYQLVSNRNAALAMTQIGSYSYVDQLDGVKKQIRFVRPGAPFSVQAQIFRLTGQGLGDLLSIVPGENILVRKNVFQTTSLTLLDPYSQDSIMRELESSQGTMQPRNVTFETHGGIVTRLHIN